MQRFVKILTLSAAEEKMVCVDVTHLSVSF